MEPERFITCPGRIQTLPILSSSDAETLEPTVETYQFGALFRDDGSVTILNVSAIIDPAIKL